MRAMADDVFLLFFILSEVSLFSAVCYVLYKLGEHLRKRQLRRAEALREQRKAEWAAEIERAGIRLMNGTAEYHKSKPEPIRKVCGLYAVEGQKYIEK